MAQPKHYDSDGCPYFIESNTLEKQPFFKNDFWARFFLWELALIGSKEEVFLHAFVLMPTHFHLLLTFDSEKFETNISQILKSLKGRSARGLNFIFDRKGNVWQRGFHDCVVRVEQSIQQAIEYIHNNPVEAGLVEEPGQWPFSSYWSYVDEVRYSLPVKIVKPILL